MSTKAEQLVAELVNDTARWATGDYEAEAVEMARAPLLAYVSLLEADRERVNFLEASAIDVPDEVDGIPDGRVVLLQVNYDGNERLPLREAIDAAAKQDAGTK